MIRTAGVSPAHMHEAGKTPAVRLMSARSHQRIVLLGTGLGLTGSDFDLF